ncbi:MAG: hypothetical protein VYE64_12125 [Planctomycetota bacterium]|nr:hypothetical protein [Planctomycetota bacterium]
MNLETGSILEGDITDLDFSDNQSMIVKTQIRRGLNAVFDASSPSESPTAIELTFEGFSVTGRPVIIQEIALYNFQTADYEVVRTKRMPIAEDESFTVDLSGDLSRFIEPGTCKMEARMVHKPAPRRFW